MHSPRTLQALRLTVSGSWGIVSDVELSPFYTVGCNAYRVLVFPEGVEPPTFRYLQQPSPVRAVWYSVVYLRFRL